MAKPRKKPPPVEDEAQSKRFLELARELEDAGELSPGDDGKKLDQLVSRSAPKLRTDR
jgi:hypothetical protein